MKRIHMVAGAFLLSTSALAWAADGEKSSTLAKAALIGAESAKVVAAQAVVKPDVTILSAQDQANKAANLEFAALDKSLEPLAKAETEALAWADKPAAVETGMGGPLQEVDTGTAVATANYPPCSPGPGDDRCIQLYEPGVRAQLASGSDSTFAMGGPFEAVETGDLKAEKDETLHADKVKTVAVAPEAGVTGHSEGVGGPVEARSGYPPCSPGAGDDRCIQLYEPGVTGAGN